MMNTDSHRSQQTNKTLPAAGLKNTMADVAGNMELFLSGEVGPETLVTGMAPRRGNEER